MTISKNPFTFRELPPNAPFCNRTKELSELISYAEGRSNVLIYSPRRFGKTSLVRRVQAELVKKGTLTVFADFFGVTSADDVAARLARSVYEVTRTKENVFKSAVKFLKSFRPVLKPDETGSVSLSVEPSSSRVEGLALLEETMESIGEFISKTPGLFHIALDEFQEIVELKDASNIEGIMRTHIQRHEASYFFIGSRRHILLAIFNERQRPFFQSAINYEIKTLPRDELITFIKQMFEESGKKCSPETAESIIQRTRQHPYYSQKFSFFVFETADKTVTEADVKNAFEIFIESERPVFDAILQGLAPQQIALLKAIACEPTRSIFSISYMKRRHLGSTGGVQGALKRLLALDLVEQDDGNMWTVVDPILERWLK